MKTFILISVKIPVGNMVHEVMRPIFIFFFRGILELLRQIKKIQFLVHFMENIK